MDNKSLEETKRLNAEARANTSANGGTKVSMTHPNAANKGTTTTSNSSTTTSTTNLEETKQLNMQSRANKGTHNR